MIFKMISILLLTGIFICTFGLQAVIGQNDRDKLEYRHQVEYDKLVAARENAEKFNENSTTTYFAGEYGTDWLLRAVSAKAREKWADRWTVTGDARKIFDKELDKLAALASRKLKSFKPGPQFFAYHGKQEETQMKLTFDQPEKMVIHKIGLYNKEWKQEGTRSPQQIGYVWARNPDDDHPYCHLYMFRLTKAFIGDGKYSDDCDASLLDDSILIGCP